MSDFRDDPNFVHHEAHYHDDGSPQWAAVAVILLLVGALVIGAAVPTGEGERAMNSPAAETTGSASSGSTATMTAVPRQMQH